MTNFGALSILALNLRGADKVITPVEADLRLLIALETFTPDEHGDRHVGMKLLASDAGLTYITARRARDRLAAQKVVSYTAGNGNGKVSTFRLLFEIKVLSQGEHLENPHAVENGDKVLSQGEHLPADNHQHADGKGAHQAVEKVLTLTAKGAHQNASTCGNENTALEPLCSSTSALGSLVRTSCAPGAASAAGHDDDSLIGYVTYRTGWEREHCGRIIAEILGTDGTGQVNEIDAGIIWDAIHAKPERFEPYRDAYDEAVMDGRLPPPEQED